MKFLVNLSSLLLFCTSALFASDVHRLTVGGNSTIYKPADTLTLSIGMVTFDKNARVAMRANADKMSHVMDALTNMGLTPDEIQTRDYEITPHQTPAPQNPPSNWQPTIAGYEVRNFLEVNTSKIEMAGEIIDAAGNAGANFIQNISFSLKNIEAAKAEAITQAFGYAEMYAYAAVKDSKVVLGDILEIAINQSNICGGMAKSRINFDACYVPTPINPSKVEVTASVSVTYTINPKV